MIKLFILYRFIKQFGKRLRILRLENCTFLNNEVLYWISTCCPCLQGKFVKVKQIELSDFHDKSFLFSELNLRGCRDLESNAFWHLGKLHMMERLILDNTQIELPTLLVSLQSMTSLSHLSLGTYFVLRTNVF